jgi:hypothetical protein
MSRLGVSGNGVLVHFRFGSSPAHARGQKNDVSRRIIKSFLQRLRVRFAADWGIMGED